MKKSIIFGSLLICLLMLLTPSLSAIEIQQSNKTVEIKSSILNISSVKLNENEEIFSEKKSTHVIIPGDGDRKFYAIIAGCTEYEDSSHNLPPFGKPFPESTLKYVYNILVNASNWNEKNIILLLNDEATKQNILDAFIDMGNIIDGDDIFLFSWNGHGTQVEDLDGDDGDGLDEAICPYDIKSQDNNLLNIITDDELDSYFSMIGAEGLFIMFESCMSGGLVDREIQTNISFVDVNDNRRVVVMSTPPDKIGFAMFNIGWPMLLLYGMAFSDNSCDIDNNGWISAEEAFMYVNETYPVLENEFFLKIINLSILSATITYFLWFYKMLRILKTKSIMRLGLSTLLASILYKYYHKESNIQMLIESINLQYDVLGVKNNPNICDDYPGELDIIKI